MDEITKRRLSSFYTGSTYKINVTLENIKKQKNINTHISIVLDIKVIEP